MEKIFDMVIVGGGPGGYTAALYGARAGLSVVLLERAFPGGQMVSASQIDNYPGLPDGIDGISLGDQMRKGAERFGARTVYADVTGLELSVEPKVVRTEGGSFLGRTVVIATGASPRGLGLEKEEALTGRGVSYCAACDGMFFRDKTVVVVGGGNSAVADALTLSRVAGKVILVHRRDSLRATKLYHEPLMEAPNVQILWNSQVEALLGQEKLHGVQVRDLISGKVETV
jgi:thioredoxin reductase (NADPH)